MTNAEFWEKVKNLPDAPHSDHQGFDETFQKLTAEECILIEKYGRLPGINDPWFLEKAVMKIFPLCNFENYPND